MTADYDTYDAVLDAWEEYCRGLDTVFRESGLSLEAFEDVLVEVLGGVPNGYEEWRQLS